MARSLRSGRPYERLKAQVRREEPDCWLCGLPIDMDLPRTTGKGRAGHPWSWSLDHIVPLNHGGDELARDNAHSAHLKCNEERGDGPPPSTPKAPKKRRHTRRW